MIGYSEYGVPKIWQASYLIVLYSLLLAIILWIGYDRSKSSNKPKTSGNDAKSTDPGLLKKHSSYRSYRTSTTTYPSVRVFYRPHSQVDKLPSKPPIPLLVFVHGLGGCLAQFHQLLTCMVNVAPCLGIDFPGCGFSQFSPREWKDYSPASLVDLLVTVINEHCRKTPGQSVILVGHSLGCSLSTLLASKISPVHVKREFDVLGLVAICPKVTVPSDRQIITFERILSIPSPIFDLWRRWDRRGGPDSVSVLRFVGPSSSIETKKLQERFNSRSHTPVWRRMAWGALPERGGVISERRGLPGADVWAGLTCPIFLVAGEADKITTPDEVVKISRALKKVAEGSADASNLPDRIDIDLSVPVNSRLEHSDEDKEKLTSSSETTFIGEERPNATTLIEKEDYIQRRQVLKTSILPAPASHALLYDPASYRTLAGLIQSFLSEHIDTRLDLGWQLQHLSTEGKWDVKNLAKWQAVKPVSEPIAGIFRAMKTLREVDSAHSPEHFTRDWRGKIRAVVDISHESPVYDPKGLDKGGIEYHKFPTVSKIPPTLEETKDFTKLVDELRTKPADTKSNDGLIGVHCHYGFNRTGYFICSYLIEREGFGVQQAIDEFGIKRPPGIRHEHFLDALFVRYCVGLKKAPTF